MSIFFDFHVGPPGRRFRRAVDSDKSDIELFSKTEINRKLFGDVDIGSLIELSTLPICMINENKDVVGFMALCDSPNVTSVNPADWETWIRNMFQRFYMSRNTLFIHFMCFVDSVSDYFMEESIISAFFNDFYLTQICLVVCTTGPDEDLMNYLQIKKRKMYKYTAKSPEVSDKVYYFLYTAQRLDFCPKLKMRRAVEEDNDDIVAILDAKNPKLVEAYGRYYISEIIGSSAENARKILVAEHQEQAVGVMCLNTAINYKKLQHLYDLQPFYGLRKATPLEKEQNKRKNKLLSTFGNPIMLGKWSPFDDLGKMEEAYFEDIFSKENIQDDKYIKHSKVSFKRNAAMRRSMDDIIYHHKTSDDYSEKESLPITPSQTLSFTDILLEEDSFDYEIVNIDKSLLVIPEMASLDNVFKSTTSNLDIPAYDHKKLQRRMSTFKSTKSKDFDQISYDGAPNAFMIELFGLRDDIDERSGFDLLEAAFELMKDYDYCIIRVPSEDKGFPLLQHFCFVPIKHSICCNYALYVAHRSILGKLRVREAELIDIPSIAYLLNNLDGKETLWTIENSIHNKREFKSYVFMSGLSLVGVAILEPPEHIDFLRAKYNINPYYNHKYHNISGRMIDSGFATLKVAIAYSAFEVHFRFFSRELMRLSGSNSIVWMTAYRNRWVVQKANSIASTMIPLIPRQSQINFRDFKENHKYLTLSQEVMAFSTWFISKKLTSIPKLCIATNIVVVGASRTAMAFFNSLLFGDSSSYLTFTNVTLISPYGLPYTRNSNSKAEMMFPRYHTSSEKFMKSTPYTYYLNVIHGTVVEINRQKKYVTLSNGSKYHYDLLFLMFGRQYQHPHYLKPLIEREEAAKAGRVPPYVHLDVPHLIDLESQITNYDLPNNVFIINNIIDANRALNYLKNRETYQNGNIIIYGATIHAYCCLATLLESNIPEENIIWVEPFPPEDRNKIRVPFFCNINVDKTVNEVINCLKIKVYRSYYFRSWLLGYNKFVTQVDFLSHFKTLNLDCAVFFYYGRKGLNTEAFVAINKSGMVYDKGILIDHEFRTNDPSIYAAGPATAYFRRYYSESSRHKYYDCYEIGEKLGDQIRNQLDPLFTEKKKASAVKAKSISFDLGVDNFNISKESMDLSYIKTSKIYYNKNNKLPYLKKPLVTNCILPGGLQYLEVRSPGKKIPHQYVQSLPFTGFTMETFKGGYFKLHFNKDLIVDGITCLSSEKYAFEDFKNIYGRSAVVLNNIHLRYSAKKVDDFFNFFRSPWAFFLYHDQADELFAMVKELLPKGDPQGNTLAEALRLVDVKLNDPTSRKSTEMDIRYNFEKSPHIEAITDYVLEWLSTNEILLPMYHHPTQTTAYVYGNNRNAAFKRKKRNIQLMMSTISKPN